MPPAANRLRHKPTVLGRTPSSRDTSSLRLPSRQARTILARSTRRASEVRLRARFSSSALCSAEHANATATRVTRHLSWYAKLRYHTKYRISMQLSTSILTPVEAKVEPILGWTQRRPMRGKAVWTSPLLWIGLLFAALLL